MSNEKLILFSSDRCPPCKPAKKQLKELGKKFEVKKLEEDREEFDRENIKRLPTVEKAERRKGDRLFQS